MEKDKAAMKDTEKDKAAMKEDESFYDDLWDNYAAERYNKKRSELKNSDFLDPERRLSPLLIGKNVAAAVSTWGMYKGPMSFETFKRKLTARAKNWGAKVLFLKLGKKR